MARAGAPSEVGGGRLAYILDAATERGMGNAQPRRGADMTSKWSHAPNGLVRRG